MPTIQFKYPRWPTCGFAALLLCCLLALPQAARAGDSVEVKTADILSSEFTYAYLAGGVLLPLLSADDYAGRQQSLRTADALGVSVVAAELLKKAFHEQRPDSEAKDSFPSGHATAAFAVATMQAHYDADMAPYWYAGAAAISYSRVRLNRHHVKDVVAGAALGYGLARLELKLPHGYVLQPWIEAGDDTYGVAIHASF